MERQAAIKIISDTMENPFDKGRFTFFVKNLLKSIEEASFSYKGNLIPDAYEQYVSSLERIGKYTDEGHKIDVLVVKLRKKTSIERARTMQRNFIAWYLNGSRGGERKDAALAAFVSPNEEDWRFSLIKMDYRFEEGKSGKVKVKEEFTPARRWSFLVGTNENSHTAQSKLYPIIADDEHRPTLAKLEEAFSIEKVTKEFFEKYRDLFLRTKETLDEVVSGNANVRADFKAKGVNTVDFAKKLLGQIVFLYFLQKKGWFGVARDADWGTGSRHFLRELFNSKHGAYKNFFNDILEPLFYEALRIDRSHDDGYYSRFNCKIPFLNGGLFDPINNYDWVHTDIILPNELFSSNIKTKEDTGTGILDVFDRYNFTVKEDEPLEKEVAVDPEMLGKVFENLLEVKDRKSKGTYYTPREIVHYMCQQSLINYLHTTLNDVSVSYEKLGEEQTTIFKDSDKKPQLDLTIEHRPCPVISKEEIETLIKYGEGLIENEIIAEKKKERIRQGLQKGTTKKNELSKTIIDHAKMIDVALKNIKVCDPAIGSGAFPVGMMSEIVKTRNVLSAFIKEQHRTVYDFKRECIEKSLYGVDIDPGAAEIAKLRLWLSLVVDEDDIKQIKPLPNLDYKIVCGNSLSSVNTMFHHQALQKLEEHKGKFFEETNPTKKSALKVEIDNLISEITHNDKHFDFKVYFSEVFNPNGGFDVVIANPPYVRHEAIKEIKPELRAEFGDFYCGTADIYTYFYKKGVNILKANGHLCFIAPNKFMRAGYGRNTRTLLTTEVTPLVVIDFCDLPIFDATTYPAIILCKRGTDDSGNKAIAATFTDAAQLERLEETLSFIAFKIPVSALKEEGWNLERPEVLALMEKLKNAGKPLGEYVEGKFYYGIKTGLNEAFVIDAETRKRLISEDPKSKELIKPWLRGRDIKKWKAEWAKLYVIFIPWHFPLHDDASIQGASEKAEKAFQNQYPAIYKHLIQFKELLSKRNAAETGVRYEWYALQRCAATYYKEFEEPKIIWGNMATSPKFAFDSDGFYISAPANLLPASDSYLVGLLNSSICKWLIAFLAAVRGGNFLEFKPMYVEQVPVYAASEMEKAPIIERVNKILANPESPEVPSLEAEIDRLVYALYGLTPEEIAIVEGKG